LQNLSAFLSDDEHLKRKFPFNPAPAGHAPGAMMDGSGMKNFGGHTIGNVNLADYLPSAPNWTDPNGPAAGTVSARGNVNVNFYGNINTEQDFTNMLSQIKTAIGGGQT
jgi:hypothetical protein